MRENKKTIKLIGIPEVYKSCYKTVLRKIYHCRKIQEINDTEIVNHTVLGLLKRQGFEFVQIGESE